MATRVKNLIMIEPVSAVIMPICWNFRRVVYGVGSL